MTDPGPLELFGGVSLAEVRASLAFEAAQGRGPDSPARRQQVRDEIKELIRVAEHFRANPRDAPRGHKHDSAALRAWKDELALLTPESAPAKPKAKGGRRVPLAAGMMGMEG